MAERLREVAQLFPSHVDLLGVKARVVWRRCASSRR
jgi:hypothetical protein